MASKAKEDVIMGDLAAAMEVVKLPDDMDVATREFMSTLPNLSQQPTRPLDNLAPDPADPVSFEQPRYFYGKRADVLCYNPDTGSHEVVKDVFFRDYSRLGMNNNGADQDAADARIQVAYWKVPYKQPIKTIMGHVDICMVLERCMDDDDDNDSEDSENDDNEDIVFQWTRRRVAVKVNYCDRMEKLRGKHAEDPLKEIAAMQFIGESHPNVLGCQEVLFDGKNLNVVMRYCDAGDLFQLLQDAQALHDDAPEPPPHMGLTEAQARYWFKQIMSGVQYLHDIGVCHRDLSPENVMIDREAGALIIDMGMCLRVPYVTNMSLTPTDKGTADASVKAHPGVHSKRCFFKPQGACGKLPYMSPEIYKNRTPFDGAAADVWTSGTILFCMLTGNRSYQRPHASDPQFYWMSRGLTQLLNDWHVELSPQGVHLLQNMLQTNPRLRLTIDEVMNHPWMHMSGPNDATEVQALTNLLLGNHDSSQELTKGST